MVSEGVMGWRAREVGGEGMGVKAKDAGDGDMEGVEVGEDMREVCEEWSEDESTK